MAMEEVCILLTLTYLYFKHVVSSNAMYIYTLCMYRNNALAFIVGNNNTKNKEEHLPQ